MRRGAGGLVARATEADFVRMKEHLDALERATDQQSFREAGYAFHLEIARATRNPLLVRIFEMIIEARARAGGTSFAISTTTVSIQVDAATRNIHPGKPSTISMSRGRRTCSTVFPKSLMVSCGFRRSRDWGFRERGPYRQISARSPQLHVPVPKRLGAAL
jgi:hypothetical protein